VDPDPDSMTLWIRIEFGIRIHGQEKWRKNTLFLNFLNILKAKR
jgi:hypothetical protein